MNFIQQELLITEPVFVVPAPYPYDETQGIATQLALTHDEVKVLKRKAEELGLKALEGFIQELNPI
ncbi:hypothetical protein C2G38_2158777 [Gigaspora rosea]|uniref:Uncharacterized protein n=1 Tax=Gigaspora rosea TaxID=44941 RepID=A0A397W457_9GLOM|nr:hypothetical protein C2G38_2158777 [Gigaspora rosea]